MCQKLHRGLNKKNNHMTCHALNLSKYVGRYDMILTNMSHMTCIALNLFIYVGRYDLIHHNRKAIII